MNATFDYATRSIAICDSQPLIIEGIQSVFSRQEKFKLLIAVETFDELQHQLNHMQPEIVLVDKKLSDDAFRDWLKCTQQATNTVVWGSAISEAETIRLLHAGVRGVLRKSATPETLLRCLEAVAQGNSWVQQGMLRGCTADERYPRSALTPREGQVLALVEQGLTNSEIAQQLGICAGTVKIHLKHIFEKTGVRGRYGLALTGMRHRGVFSVPDSSKNDPDSLISC